MKSIQRINLSLAVATLILSVGCASGPARKKGPSPYSASWVGQDGTSGSKECATDNGFMKLQWKQLVTLSGQCVRAKNFIQVERIANQLAKIEPESPWGGYFLSLAAEAKKDMPRAYWMVELALKKAPEDGIILFQRARLHWSEKNHTLALKDLESAIKYNPSIPDAHLQMAQVQFTLGDISSAIDSFNRTLQLDSNQELAWYGLAEAKFQKKSYDEAYSHFQRVRRMNPKNAMSSLRMAQIQEIHFKNMDKSLELYRSLQRDVSLNRLDGQLPVNLSEKIKALEIASKPVMAPADPKAQASKREPTSKKVSK